MRTATPLLAAALLFGCGDDPRTEIVIVVDTDLAVPGEMDRTRVVIESPEGVTREAMLALSPDTLPGVLGMVHEGGPLGPFDVLAAGELGGATVVERRARVSFVPGRTVILRMDLVRDCIGATCGPDRTCAPQGCRDVEIDPAELAPWRGRAARLDEIDEPDAGPVTDGGMDAGGRDAGGRDAGERDGGGRDAGEPDAGEPDAGEPDAGEPDAGEPDAGEPDAGEPDAGPPDAGPGDAGPCPARCGDCMESCSGACTCDDACPCALSCAGDCAPTCSAGSACVVDGPGGGSVDATCGGGSTCTYAVAAESDVTVVCSGGSTCEVDCTGTASCSVTCTGASSCRVRCADATSCDIVRCTGGPVTMCPGDVLVCGRGC